MKAILHLTLAASLAAGVIAKPHDHQHRHVKKHPGSKFDKRAPAVVTVYEVGPTVTLYKLGGETVDEEEAKKGIDDGVYVVVGETTPTYIPPPPSTSVATSTKVDAQFFESKVLSTSTSTTATPTPTPTPSPSPSPSVDSAPKGLDAEFPDGKLDCKTFPSDYGAVPIDYLNLNGWSGVQKTPTYSPGDSAISFIETAIGVGALENSFCSYSCPPGYQKTQWPKSQGATLQSIGGLYCDAAGKLRLSRPEKKTLCEKGAGGVFVQNDLEDQACVCRTDYPGTESMTIPVCPKAGEKLPLCNPYSPDYYIWNNMPTTAQYYLNKKGLGVKDTCVWNSPVDPDGAGNWAPVNIGVGKNAEGITYISIFPNLPTSHAVLGYNVEIIGDVSAPCSLVNGVYTGGGNGCTTGLPSGGVAIIRLYN